MGSKATRPAYNDGMDAKTAVQPLETATLGGGCFWCLEAVFEELDGVAQVVSGYAGGQVERPNYHQVCSGTTGHAEVVQVAFDPAVMPFRELLRVFFVIHDPTTLNRQGADVGTQYRSVIFYHSPQQKADADAVMAELRDAKIWERHLVTELMPFERFWPAEEYHQGYYRQNPEQGYCQAVISPKVAKLRKQFAARLKKYQD